MYGAQTKKLAIVALVVFENDVEMYGAQTGVVLQFLVGSFENDVEMYGAQTNETSDNFPFCLRMM